MTYISWFSDFALYLEYYLLDKCHTWDISSMWPNEWPLTISRSLWPIFHGSVILPYILNTICWINVTPGILVPCDPMNDHLLYLGHYDLYFMLQWFCLLFLLLFHGELSYLDYYIYVTKLIYIQIHLGQCDLYYMVEWFRHITWKLFHRLFHFDFLNDKNVTI